MQYKPRSRAAKWRRNIFILVFPSLENAASLLPALTESPQAATFSSALVPRKLFSVGASCVAADLALDTDSLSMGVVFVNTSATKRVKITNTGDVGCTYAISLEKLQRDLKIFPVTGFLAPGENATLDITYNPVSAGEFTAYARCLLDGQPLAAQPLVISGILIA